MREYPALSSKPLSVKEWMNKMGANEYKAIGRNDAKKIVTPDGDNYTQTPPVYTIVEDDYFNAHDLWLEKKYLKSSQVIEDNIPVVKSFMDLEKYNILAQKFRKSLEQGKTEIDHYINLAKTLSEKERITFQQRYRNLLKHLQGRVDDEAFEKFDEFMNGY